MITRSVLAAALGDAMVFVGGLATYGLSLVANGLMGQIRVPADAVEHFSQVLGNAAATAGGQLLTVIPLVIFVGFLLRMWLERHPSEHGIIGVVDTA